jgi:hypothetical protein
MLRRLYIDEAERAGDRSRDISLFAEFFHEIELWSSYASGHHGRKGKMAYAAKGEDCPMEMIDFASLEAAFCDTRLVQYHIIFTLQIHAYISKYTCTHSLDFW